MVESLAPRSAGGAPDAAAPQLGLGYSLYNLPGMPLFDALKLIAEIGYDGVELVLMPGAPSEPKLLSRDQRRELRSRLQSMGLALPGVMENLSPVVDEARHQANLDRLKQAGELAHDLSPEAPPVLETVLGGSPDKWDAMKNQMVDRLKSWAETAADARMVVAVKPHVSGALHLPTDARWLVEQVASPWIKLAYDYSHYQAQGLPMVASMQAVVPYAAFVHVKDAAPTPGKVQFVLPGDGPTDYVAYLRELASRGYRGQIVAEVSALISKRPGFDAEGAARRCYANLAPAFTKAGVARPG